jgi:hypothetical protein
MGTTLNRKREFRTRRETRRRHTDRLANALANVQWYDATSATELAEALYDQGIRVKQP